MWCVRTYRAGGNIAWVEGARKLEGVVLVAATVMLFRRRPSLAVTLPAAIAASGVAAATAAVPMDAYAGRSYFAMVAALALGMTLRARGRRRVAWAAASLASGIGFWLASTNGVAIWRSSFALLAAELGLVGLGAFVVWIGAAVARSGRALLRTPSDSRLLGITIGVVILLASCLVARPLDVDEVAFPFWIQLGLMSRVSRLDADERRRSAGTRRVEHWTRHTTCNCHPRSARGTICSARSDCAPRS